MLVQDSHEGVGVDTRSRDEVIAGWDEGVSGTVVKPERVFHLEHMWGTVITFDIPTSETDMALSIIDECLGLFRDIDQIFSTYKALSEVSLYRNGLERPGASSPMFNVVLADCRRIRSFTHGSFDPWSVPGGYDPSGYVKGWAVGLASAMISEVGLSDHMINAGGDIAASGSEDPGDPQAAPGWPVGILNPATKSDVVEVVQLLNESICTSGRYERGNHVIDPRSGQPITAVDSVSVIGPTCGLADAFASAAFVDGPEKAMTWFANLSDEWSIHFVVGETAYTHGKAFQDES